MNTPPVPPVDVEDKKAPARHRHPLNATGPAGHGGPPAGRGRSAAYTIVGVVGELLITAGVLIGLFVVWEMWWTTVEAQQAQAAQSQAFSHSQGYVQAKSGEGPKYTTDPPIPAKPANHETFAQIHVPRWGTSYDVPIMEGVDKPGVLDKGAVGHYPETQLPGEIGNFAVAGHRITHGEPFAGIEQLQVGDEIIIETADTWYVYTMTSKDIVLPTDVDVIDPVPNEPGATPTKRMITLTTCHPRYTSTHRYIVWGEFEYWMKKSEGTPASLLGQ